MTNRIKSTGIVLMAALSLGACDSLLDVNNPNNLVEESIQQPSAASAVVNGAQARTARAIGFIWQPYAVAADEFYWIGSRDAWLSLDQGFISDPNNEFTDAAFPPLGDARWLTDLAVETLQGHVANTPSTRMKTDLARAHLYAGIMHMVIGEVQEDFALSDKTETAPPLGPENMYTLLDEAITHFDAAVSGATDVGDADLKLKATALRARAKHSRAIWDQINPSPKSGSGLVGSASAATDALAAIGLAGGAAADWNYDFHYSAGTVGNDLANWVNDRKENQVDLTLVNVNAANDIASIKIQDPIDAVADPAFLKRLEKFKDGAFNSKGSQYSPLTIVSTRLMHLIAAEDALAKGDNAGFTTHVNHVRAMDGLTPYSGQVDAADLLKHERRVNTWLMGLRLGDMYRFGIKAAGWQTQGDAVSKPGTMLPITIVEIRSNCYLNGAGC
ncbi:MAG TPA: hypothetical protein VLA36_03770 [Longimicrobiales bacterium]|nr:hypothetical protein [Longimicrobiales bacterium]